MDENLARVISREFFFFFAAVLFDRDIIGLQWAELTFGRVREAHAIYSEESHTAHTGMHRNGKLSELIIDTSLPARLES